MVILVFSFKYDTFKFYLFLFFVAFKISFMRFVFLSEHFIISILVLYHITLHRSLNGQSLQVQEMNETMYHDHVVV